MKYANMAVAFSLIVIFGVLSFMRSALYVDELLLWKDIVVKSPNKARPHHELGFAFMMAGNLQEATVHLERAVAMSPNYEYALVNLAIVYNAIGRKDKARELIARNIAINPNFLPALYKQALWDYETGMLTEALRKYNRIIQIDPFSKEAEFARQMIKLIDRNNQWER